MSSCQLCQASSASSLPVDPFLTVSLAACCLCVSDMQGPSMFVVSEASLTTEWLVLLSSGCNSAVFDHTWFLFASAASVKVLSRLSCHDQGVSRNDQGAVVYLVIRSQFGGRARMAV